jgi:TseV toxin immunity protein TsiV
VEAPQLLYNQSATHLAMPLYLRPDTEVQPQLIGDLCDRFLSNLLFPGTRLTTLWTKRPGEDKRLNMGEFTPSRWKAAQKKILGGEYAVVRIGGETPDFPRQKIAFSVHVNPAGGNEFLVSGTIEVSCSVSYLRHLAVSPAKVEALLELNRRAWNGIAGGPAYGFGHLAIILARPRFDPRLPPSPGAPMPWDIKPPEHRAHPVPIAYVGNDIEGNLADLYCKSRGIKGAFWANFLSAAHVHLAGGEATLKRALNGMRIERLEHGGLLIVATETPLPDDVDETRSRFLRLDEALRPAFLSRDETAENKRGMLGYFYRERPPLR